MKPQPLPKGFVSSKTLALFQRDLYQDSSLVLHSPAGGAGVGAWLASRQCGGMVTRWAV